MKKWIFALLLALCVAANGYSQIPKFFDAENVEWVVIPPHPANKVDSTAMGLVVTNDTLMVTLMPCNGAVDVTIQNRLDSILTVSWEMTTITQHRGIISPAVFCDMTEADTYRPMPDDVLQPHTTTKHLITSKGCLLSRFPLIDYRQARYNMEQYKRDFESFNIELVIAITMNHNIYYYKYILYGDYNKPAKKKKVKRNTVRGFL